MGKYIPPLSVPDRLALLWLGAIALVAIACVARLLSIVGLAFLVATGIGAIAAWAARSRTGRIVHDFLPIATIFAVFNLVGPVVALVNPRRWDVTLAAMDQRFFGRMLHAWRDALGRPNWLTDAASLAYVSFYFVPVAMAVALYQRGKRRDFDRFVLTLVTAFFLPYIGYLLFPAAGPRAPTNEVARALGGGAITRTIDAVLRAGEINRLDAFPSGHATVSITLLALGARFFPRWRAPLAFWVASILFSTVYLSLHYLVDLAAGAAVAGLVPGAATLLKRALGPPDSPAERAPAEPRRPGSWASPRARRLAACSAPRPRRSLGQ